MEKAEQWLSGEVGKELTGKGREIDCLDVGNALYLNRDLGYTGVWIYQNLLNDTLTISACRITSKEKQKV